MRIGQTDAATEELDAATKAFEFAANEDPAYLYGLLLTHVAAMSAGFAHAVAFAGKNPRRSNP